MYLSNHDLASIINNHLERQGHSRKGPFPKKEFEEAFKIIEPIIQDALPFLYINTIKPQKPKNGECRLGVHNWNELSMYKRRQFLSNELKGHRVKRLKKGMQDKEPSIHFLDK